MDEKVRTSVEISAYHYKWLKIWGYFQTKGTTTLAKDIIHARVEFNMELIKNILAERAKDLGISEEELIDKILNEKKTNHQKDNN